MTVEINQHALRRVFGSVVTAAIVVSAPAHTQQPISVNNMGWLAGEWIGDGRSGDNGSPTGIARLYWTPVIADVISSTFTWHDGGDDHVHYAFSVFRQVEDGVEGAGIHYGADFETFEDAPWRFQALEISDTRVMFECISNCRANSVTFTLLENDALEGRWDPVNGSDPDWITRYRRVSIQ